MTEEDLAEYVAYRQFTTSLCWVHACFDLWPPPVQETIVVAWNRQEDEDKDADDHCG